MDAANTNTGSETMTYAANEINHLRTIAARIIVFCADVTTSNDNDLFVGLLERGCNEAAAIINEPADKLRAACNMVLAEHRAHRAA